MNNYIWKSKLAPHLQEYLSLKRMAGLKYEWQGRLLEKFDEYCYNTGFDAVGLNIGGNIWRGSGLQD